MRNAWFPRIPFTGLHHLSHRREQQRLLSCFRDFAKLDHVLLATEEPCEGHHNAASISGIRCMLSTSSMVMMPSPQFPVCAVLPIPLTISSQRSSGPIRASTMPRGDKSGMAASIKKLRPFTAYAMHHITGDSRDAGVVHIAHDFGTAFDSMQAMIIFMIQPVSSFERHHHGHRCFSNSHCRNNPHPTDLL